MITGMHSDWLPITLPGDVRLLRKMLRFEQRFGSRDVADVIEKRINRLDPNGSSQHQGDDTHDRR